MELNNKEKRYLVTSLYIFKKKRKRTTLKKKYNKLYETNFFNVIINKETKFQAIK